MSGSSNPVPSEIEKMFSNLDWLIYGLSVGITEEDIEVDAQAKVLSHSSRSDIEASGSRWTRYEIHVSEPSDDLGDDIGEESPNNLKDDMNSPLSPPRDRRYGPFTFD